MSEKEIVTNSDKIREMTDEDMAKFVLGKACPPGECTEALLTWLRSPVEGSKK